MTLKRRAETMYEAESQLTPQSDLRRRILTAASELLSTGGTEAVTTRAVAEAAGVQTPALYRFFRDKTALLEALVDFGFAAYLAAKPQVPDPGDPVAALHKGWDLHVEFGLSHPALYRLIYADGRSTQGTALTVRRTMRHQIARIAAEGRLRIDQNRAVQYLHAATCGVVLTLLDMPETERDLSLSRFARDAAFAAITLEAPVASATTNATLAVTLRARLHDESILTEMERGLMGEWLDRIANARRQSQAGGAVRRERAAGQAVLPDGARIDGDVLP